MKTGDKIKIVHPSYNVDEALDDFKLGAVVEVIHADRWVIEVYGANGVRGILFPSEVEPVADNDNKPE